MKLPIVAGAKNFMAPPVLGPQLLVIYINQRKLICFYHAVITCLDLNHFVFVLQFVTELLNANTRCVTT